MSRKPAPQPPAAPDEAAAPPETPVATHALPVTGGSWVIVDGQLVPEADPAPTTDL